MNTASESCGTKINNVKIYVIRFSDSSDKELEENIFRNNGQKLSKFNIKY